MSTKEVRFINSGTLLNFNVGGFAINPRTGDTAWSTADWRDILLGLVGTGNVVVHGSVQIEPPDFSAASTVTNLHTTIVLADYSIQNTYYDGPTGVTAAGDTKIVEVNTNLLTWIAIERSAETVDVVLTITNAQ